MDTSPLAAREALKQIEHTVREMRQRLVSRGTDLALIAWGLVWAACYIATHLLVVHGGPEAIGTIWMAWAVGLAIGAAAMTAIGITHGRDQPVRSEQARHLGHTLGWFWCALGLFAIVWLTMLWPWHPLQMNAFLVTLVMFAYVVMGMWLLAPALIVIGIAIAVTTAIGYLLTVLTTFAGYNLWMAVSGGGGLIAGGFYLRWRWR